MADISRCFSYFYLYIIIKFIKFIESNINLNRNSKIFMEETMFVYSLKASTLKFFAVVCVALTALITMITFIPSYDGGELKYITTGAEGEINYSKVKTNDDRVAFLSQFGWTVNPVAVEEIEVNIPEKFDKVFVGYNEIQKRQGLDLSKYKGKKVMRYTYEITNYTDSSERVYANIIVYRNNVIGGDVCSANVGGFIHGFEKG